MLLTSVRGFVLNMLVRDRETIESEQNTHTSIHTKGDKEKREIDSDRQREKEGD